MKISVIIPVGDADVWMRCEKSIRASIALIPEDAEEDVEFEVLPCFDLEHNGAYVARNEGLSQATGDWIAWVDCDDTVEEGWAREIAGAITDHPAVDVIQFDATEVRNGKTRSHAYRYYGMVEGEAFAHELLRNDGMPTWLWTRVFRRGLFDGLKFAGRVKHDYGMFLKILSCIKKVWSIGKPLYRYNRHGNGLSNYVQQMDYAKAGRGFESSIARLPEEWQHDARIGLVLTMADVARHSKCENGSRQFVRKYLREVIIDGKVPLRLKVKTILAAIGI